MPLLALHCELPCVCVMVFGAVVMFTMARLRQQNELRLNEFSKLND